MAAGQIFDFDEVIKRLSREFKDLNLSPLLTCITQVAASKKKLDPDVLYDNLAKFIERNRLSMFIRSGSDSKLMIDGQFEDELTMLDRDYKPLPEECRKEVLRGVTTEDIERFLYRLQNDFLEVCVDNRYDYNQHPCVGCDCYDFIQKQFPHVSQSSYKRIWYCLSHWALKIQKHGTLAVAIFSFFVENQISQRPELANARNFFTMPPRLPHWWDIIHRHLTEEHAKVRQNKFKHWKPRPSQTEMIEDWNKILSTWKQDFPMFFTDDGLINQNALMYPERGPTFVCILCNKRYIKKIMISCAKPENCQVISVHVYCPMCIKNFVKDGKFPKSMNSTRVGVKCPQLLCNNPIPLDILLPLVKPGTRIIFRNEIWQSLFKVSNIAEELGRTSVEEPSTLDSNLGRIIPD